MITLAAADTIAGGADAASILTCTIFGMELNAGVEVYKVLYQGQLAASPATIYTVPGSTQAFIRSIAIVNNDSVNRTFSLFRGGTAATNKITPTWTLLPGGMAVYEDGLGWQFFNSSGQLMSNLFSSVSGIDNYGITNSKGETVDRNVCTETNTAIGATGVLFMQAIWLTVGTVVSNISFHSATTAAGTPTHWLFGLYDINRNLRAVTADQTSTAWAAQTIKTVAVTTPYTIPSTGLYYLAIMMTATTVVTLKGNTGHTDGTLSAAAPKISGTSTTGLTTTLPDPAAAISSTLTIIWGCVT